MGSSFSLYLVFSGRVWPLFIYVWPSVALNPYRYAVYIMDVCLSYFVSSGIEVNMSFFLIFNFVDAFNLLVC